jgi:Ca2+-binding EF-hand superfamily protein
MVAYARSRGDRLTRYELRRRIADIAGGPALLWTSYDFGAERSETLTLFAFLDADGDSMLSPQEGEAADEALSALDANSNGRVDWSELQLGLKPRSARRSAHSALVEWRSWDANESEHVEDLSVAVAFSNKEGKSYLTVNDCALGEPWNQNTAELQRALTEESQGQAVLMSHPKIAVALTAVQPASLADVDQISVGVTSESNALFRELDRDGNWNLSAVECRSCSDVIAALDQNADGTLEVGELPIMLRLCVARGAVAHEALTDGISVVQTLDDAGVNDRKLVPPEWFISMDKDGDRRLTRKEFVGGRAPFNKMDTDGNDLLSVQEALATKSN